MPRRFLVFFEIGWLFLPCKELLFGQKKNAPQADFGGDLNMHRESSVEGDNRSL